MDWRERPDLLDRLAADYLSGGMGSAARRRFETLAQSEPLAAQALQRWRERLDGALLPEHTPEAVWPAVQRRLGPQSQPGGATAASGWVPRIWRQLALALGGLSALALAAVVALLLQRPAQAPLRVAVLAGPPGHAAVLQLRGPQAVLTAVGDQPTPAGRSFELWVLPRQGKPLAAGLVRLHGSQRVAMPPALLAAARTARGFAISVEPAGGSPTGQPTGPVTYLGHPLAEPAAAG